MRRQPVNGLELVVDCAATFRLSRLVTTDSLTQLWRDRLILRSYLRAGMPAEAMEEDVPGTGTAQVMAEADIEQGSTATTSGLVPRLAVLLVCRWCIPVEIAAGITAARWAVPAVWDPIGYGLAAATVAGLLSAVA